MRTYILIVVAVFLFGCGVNREIREKKMKEITISGIAKDAKAGAVVQVTEKLVYYVDGHEYWDKNHIGKIVIVSGDLFFINLPQKRQKKGFAHQVMNDYYLIKNPKITLSN